MSLVYQGKSNEQLGRMIEENMGLVVNVAKSFNPQSDYELDEWVQIGLIGVFKGIRKYDSTRARLSTFIHNYSRWAILRHIVRSKNKYGIVHLQLDESLLRGKDTYNKPDQLEEYLPASLTEDEKTVIGMRLAQHSFADIGKSISRSRMSANNIYKSAIQKIQNANP